MRRIQTMGITDKIPGATKVIISYWAIPVDTEEAKGCTYKNG